MKGTVQLRQTIGARILAICMLVVAIFTLLNIYSYVKTNQMTAGYRNVIDRNASLIFKVYAAEVELSRQSALLQRYLSSGNHQAKQEFEESKVNMEAVFTGLDRDLITTEGKEGLGRVRSSVDAWHLAAMQVLKDRAEKGGASTAVSTGQLEALSIAAEQEVTAYLRFLNSRMYERTAANTVMAEQTQLLIIGANVLVIILATGLSLWLWRRISRPLGMANRLAREIASGDLRVKEQEYQGSDEIGEILQAIHTMNRSLHQLVYQVDEAATKVAGACTELTMAADDSAVAATHITENMTEVATRTEGVFRDADGMRRQMEAVAEHIEQVAGHAADAAEVARATEYSSRSGQDTIRRTIHQMENISDTTNKIGHAVEKLSEGTNRISDFVAIINGIAEQTHLLALNAAIEAARAGDAGRGFAVVAQEVNKLASESAKSAKEVSQMIQSNRRDMEAVVGFVRAGGTSVMEGSELVGAAGGEFEKIAQGVSQVTARMLDIATAVRDLSAGGKLIVEAVKRVEETSNETAGRTQAISAAVQEQTASLEQMAGSGRSLDGLAQELYGAVKRFKI
ncbi:MAG: methyl-accepting chemotaxis protein [Negativicutes bacterium]